MGEPTWWLATQQNLPAKLDTELLRLTARIAQLEAAVEACIAEIDCGGCYGNCFDPVNCRLDDVKAMRAAARAKITEAKP